MEVTVAKQVDVRANMKKYFDLACSGRAIIIPRKKNQNVVILSEADYQQLQQAKRIAEYLSKIVNTADEETAYQGGMRGALAKYADPELRKKEQRAWERAAVDRYDNV